LCAHPLGSRLHRANRSYRATHPRFGDSRGLLGGFSISGGITATKGGQLRFAGIGRPATPAPLNLAEDKDFDFLYLKPMFDNLLAEGFTVFDLRGFRPGFRFPRPGAPRWSVWSLAMSFWC